MSNPHQQLSVEGAELTSAAEFAVACACMGFSDSAARKAQSLAGSIDCQSFMDFAEIHGLVPLIYWNLLHQFETRPARFEILEARFRTEARRSLLLTSELFRVLDLLTASGVAAVAHKGPALSCSLYGDPVLRTYADIDVLVSPSDAARARAALAAAGWNSLEAFSAAEERAYIRSGYEFSFRNREGALVELQWRAAPRFYAVDFDIAQMIERAAKLEVTSRWIPVLSNDDLLLVLAVHGAKHMWARISWLVDIAALVQAQTLNWAAIIGKCKAHGTERILATALIAAGELCGISVPSEARPLLEHDSHSQPLAQELLANVVAGAGRFDNETVPYFAMFAKLRERWRDRARMVVRLALTPTTSEWSMVSLPRWLSPLYVLVRAFRLLRRVLSLLFTSRA